MTQWWSHLSGGWRATIVVVGAVVAVNLVLTGVGAVLGNDPSGPTSSSYATAADGYAGLARLYDGHGHPVERLRRRLADAELDPATTLVVADPDLILGRDSAAVGRFVRAGGRLLVAGSSGLPLVQELVGEEIGWTVRGTDAAGVLAPAAEVDGVVSVVGEGRGSWQQVGAALPVLGRSGRNLVVVAAVGAGRVVALADASPLQNRYLGRADAAEFGLAAAGERGRPVVFDEASHGYGSGGAGVLPARWSRALWVAGIAVLLLMWTTARRLGPPEEAGRDLPPPRIAYVAAMAVSLSRTREPASAVADLQRRGRADLALRLGLPADARRAEVVAAAARVGVPEAEVAPLFDAPHHADDVIDVGRAAARHRGGRS